MERLRYRSNAEAILRNLLDTEDTMNYYSITVRKKDEDEYPQVFFSRSINTPSRTYLLNTMRRRRFFEALIVQLVNSTEVAVDFLFLPEGISVHLFKAMSSLYFIR
jgi:hypothetical protein